MSNVFEGNDSMYHLHGYAIFENEDDGSLNYQAWDEDKETGKLSWIRGEAYILEDILALRGITSEGQEESAETLLELKVALTQLSDWDKTKYYGIVMDDNLAARMMYSQTGKPVQKTGEDYQEIKKTLQAYGVALQ